MHNELYLDVEKITNIVRKVRIAVYGHSKQVFAHSLNKKTNRLWLTEVETDLQEMRVMREDV